MILHAAALSSKGTTTATYAVVLSVDDEAELTKLEQDLIVGQVPHHAFREPDRNYELMSIGIEPTDRRMVRRYVGRLPLLGESK